MKNFGLKTNKLHRITAATICVVMLLGLVFQVTLFSAPEGEKKQAEQAVTRVADESTINSWQDDYGSEADTSNVGKIWTDKTVSTGRLELAESAQSMSPKEDNFMVGLSALSSTMSLTLEAAIPVDVMLVLDISGSMGTAENNMSKISKLIEATNKTIQKILDMNEKNRVGVVLYSGGKFETDISKVETAICPLPLDRYTTSDEMYFFLEETTGGLEKDLLGVAKGVKNSQGDSMYDENVKYKVEGQTYIQNGLMEAFERLQSVPSQDTEERIPVVTLVSDGAPSTARDKYTERGDSTVYANTTDIRMAFLTQLTAAWIKKSLEQTYTRQPLFYTVGLLFGLSGNQNKCARMVLNPSGEENEDADLDRWWNTFLEASPGETVHLEADGKVLDIQRAEDGLEKLESGECSDRYYVDEFFNVDSAYELVDKFEDLVEQIKFESAELPTEEEENNSNYSGYLVFEDKLGEYMNVAEMSGVMYGGELHTGSTFAKKMEKDGSAKEEEEIEFLNSLMERLHINEQEARQLLQNAQNLNQINYEESDGSFSNYIAWYADEDGNYLGPYSGEETELNYGAFVNRSYFYYGNSSNTIATTNLMYLSVRVEENLQTNEQTVKFSIPASLIPLVRYNVIRNASPNSTESRMEMINAMPVHLFYEVGLRDGISEYDLSDVDVEYEYLERSATSQIGTFYSNDWEKREGVSEASANVTFTVAEKNEYYYYTENTPIYVKNNKNEFELYEGEKPNEADENEYYCKKTAYSSDGTIRSMKKIDKRSLNVIEEAEGNRKWNILSGTFRYEKLDERKKELDKNITGTADYVYKSKLSSSLGISDVCETQANNMNKIDDHSVIVSMGNNGKLLIKQGKLSVSKIVEEDRFIEGDDENTEFHFEIDLNQSSEEKIPTLINGEMKNGIVECEIKNGIIRFALKSTENITFWLPAGMRISVGETGEHEQLYKTFIIVMQNGEIVSSKEEKQIEDIEIGTRADVCVHVENDNGIRKEPIRFFVMDNLRKPLGGATYGLYKLECDNPEHEHNKVIKEGNDSNIPNKANVKEEETQSCWKKMGEAVSDSEYGYLKFLDDQGKEIIAFQEGTYRLVEITAPRGYMKSIGQWNLYVIPGGDDWGVIEEVLGDNGERPAAIQKAEREFYFTEYKPINPPITGGRGIDRFLILGAIVAVSGLMITVHLVLQRKRGKL